MKSKFNYYNPVKVFFERDAVRNHPEVFGVCGKKAMIVTGRTSAKKCGAYGDVTDILDQNAISYCTFDRIENNPSMESVEEAAALAIQEKVDFIVGIGGGSPIDASKAISVLCANPDMRVIDLFTNGFTKALPIVVIPTTSGTGSEVTPYSVLLSHEKETKLSFGNDKTFPSYALLDSKYTFSLGEDFSVSTAVDAFTHVFEGFLANRSTPISEQLSIDGIRKFGECLPYLLKGEYTEEVRDKLMYVSMLGGMVITLTGVTIAHGMGYCYTYFKNIPHGKANGLLMKEYIVYNYPVVKEKIDTAMKLLQCESIDDFLDKLKKLIGVAPSLTDEEVERYTELTMLQKGSIANTPNPLNEEKIHQFWKRMQ